jgi:uncharacterized protein (DUF2141 family)
VTILKSLLLLTTFFVHFSSFSPNAEEGIRINIINLRNNTGHVLISLFKDGAGYPNDAEKAIRKGKVIIKDKQAWIVFTGLPSGKYAAAILHDENDDQQMNKNGLGLPKEGYGFSNNVMGAFGPPSFSRASFQYTAAGYLPVSIKMRY